jgi:hypothetical protein
VHAALEGLGVRGADSGARKDKVVHLGLRVALRAPQPTDAQGHPLLPFCSSSHTVAAALAAALNEHYGGRLSAAATVDATHTQVQWRWLLAALACPGVPCG